MEIPIRNTLFSETPTPILVFFTLTLYIKPYLLVSTRWFLPGFFVASHVFNIARVGWLHLRCDTKKNCPKKSLKPTTGFRYKQWLELSRTVKNFTALPSWKRKNPSFLLRTCVNLSSSIDLCIYSKHLSSRNPSTSYCWWKKSCTTWDGLNPINNGIIIILGGAGFCPSTVG